LTGAVSWVRWCCSASASGGGKNETVGSTTASTELKSTVHSDCQPAWYSRAARARDRGACPAVTVRPCSSFARTSALIPPAPAGSSSSAAFTSAASANVST